MTIPADVLNKASAMAAELRGGAVQTSAHQNTPPVSNLVELSDAGVDALAASRLIAKALKDKLPGFVSRTTRFVSVDGAAVLSKAASSIDSLVEAFSRLYDGGAVPSGSDDLPPQARMASGGAAPLSKALVEQLEQLVDPALPEDVRKAVTQAGSDLGGLIDLVVGLTDLDGTGGDSSITKAETIELRRGPRRAVLQLHAIGESLHADFRIEKSADHLVGWTFDLVQSAELLGDISSLEALQKVAKTWSPDGARGFSAIASPSFVKASPKSQHPAAWLTMKAETVEPGEVGASLEERGIIVAVDEPTLELGLQDEGRHEYFLTKGDLAGRLLVEQDDDGAWSARLEKADLLPDVLTRDAVIEKRMPPDGASGLPQSLEAVIPADRRYWTSKGDEARSLRDQVVESGLFGDGVVLVDKELRLVEKTMRLVEPIEAAVVVRTKSDGKRPEILSKLDGLLPEGTKRIVVVGKVENVERLAKSLSGAADEIIVFNLSRDDEIAPALKHMEKSLSDFLIRTDDTTEARELLGGVGQPFTFPLTLEKQLFLASFPVPSTIRGIEWVTKAKKAKWTTAFINGLPDSAFLWIGSGGKKDKEGKTTPRSLRKLPIRDDKGKLDLPHLRNAIARIPQTDGPTADEKKKLQARARRLLEQAKKSSTKKTLEILDRTRLIRPMAKADDDEDEDERFTLAIVLEPDEVDAQKDTYDEETVKVAAHGFMEEFQTLGIQHKEFAADRLILLESYLAPVEFDIETSDGETITIKKGTWLMAIRFVDDELWRKVKAGEITGLSIGGSAIRTPEATSSDTESSS